MSKSILINLSDKDMEILENLASNQGLKKSEYIRMLLQTIHIAESLKEENGNIKFEIGGYGYILEKEFIEEYAKQMETFFEGIEKRLHRAIIKPKKSNKKPRLLRPKKAA
jgi:predicted DNA-binding protein